MTITNNLSPSLKNYYNYSIQFLKRLLYEISLELPHKIGPLPKKEACF